MAKKILSIEDEARLQEAMAAKLESDGYEVLSAFDGETGIKMAQEHKPDLILLDLILPKKDGFEVLEELKAKPGLPAVPILALTNLEDRRSIERCLSYGVHSYLAKANYSLDEISQKIKEALQ